MSRPSNDEIARAYALTGSIRGTAKELGWDEKTLRNWAKEDAELATLFYGPDTYMNPTRYALVSKDAELRELRRENKKLVEIVGQRQQWAVEMVEAARVPVKVPSYGERKVGSGDRPAHLPERSIVLPIFDLQYGQHVSNEDVALGRGGFNERVFDERLAIYVEKVSALLEDRATSTQFTELHIVLGGDLCEGDQIFAGQAWQLEKHPIRQVLDLRVKLGDALAELLSLARGTLDVQKVALYGVPGNHGKVGGKRAGATPADYSWDWLATELVFDQLREHTVDLRVNEPAGALLFETLGHKFLVIHGDEVKGQMGIPFYGLVRLDGRAMRLAETVYDYCLLGHHHQPASIPNGSGGEFIMSGDWVGGNNLSKHIVAASRPQQRVLLVGAKHGVTEDVRVYFDDRRKRNRPTVHRV